MQSTTTIVECQPDWLTLSCSDRDRIADFRTWANHSLNYEEREGEQRKPFAMKGYRGTICGRARFGERPDGALVMLSGDPAAVELERGLGLADNCSRIDLAVTVRQEPFDPDLERSTYEAYLLSPMREGRRAHARLVQSDDSGATFYLGSRDSEVMLRLYNKQAESGDAHYTGCHRYEVEVKGHRAGITATQLAIAAYPRVYVGSMVYNYCQERGITPLFEPSGSHRIMPGFRRRSDTDKQLEWLKTQVRPTVDRLREFGKGRDARKAIWPEEGEEGGETFPEEPIRPDETTQTGDGS